MANTDNFHFHLRYYDLADEDRVTFDKLFTTQYSSEVAEEWDELQIKTVDYYRKEIIARRK